MHLGSTIHLSTSAQLVEENFHLLASMKFQNLAKKRLTSTDPKLVEDPGLAAWKFRFVGNDPFQRKPLGDPNFPQSLFLRYVLDVATWKF